MKLVIQIPCYDEAEALPETLASLPRRVEGFDEVLWLVVDDGSRDATVDVARLHGVDHVVSLPAHRGLARAFAVGLMTAVELGADVVVNTDADNQYRAEGIPSLVRPILENEADMVVGSRPIDRIPEFSAAKRALQRLGSWVVRRSSGVDLADAASGFRAFNREAALRLAVFGTYTYTLETIIQAGQSGLRVRDVPIDVNPPVRESRLVRSNLDYVIRGALAIARAYVIYRPTRFFALLSACFLLPALVLAGRYAYFVALGEGRWHVQSVIVASVLGLSAVFAVAIGVVAHLLGINRRLGEEIRYLLRAGRADAAIREEASVRPGARRPGPR